MLHLCSPALERSKPAHDKAAAKRKEQGKLAGRQQQGWQANEECHEQEEKAAT